MTRIVGNNQIAACLEHITKRGQLQAAVEK
jgi:hypothetical protein